MKRSMQENEFEKQVRNTLKGWNLPPSDELWKKLREQLPQKRRRRWLLPFILFASLAGGGGYLYYNATNNHDEIVAAKETTITNNKPSIKPQDKTTVETAQSKKQEI